MDQRQWELLQQMLAARQGAPGQPGMPGTPGGPVQESPTMETERALQIALGMAPQLALIGAGGYAGMPAGLVGLGAGAAIGAKAGQIIADPVVANATQPNIRDVWLDQLRMKMQGN